MSSGKDRINVPAEVALTPPAMSCTRAWIRPTPFVLCFMPLVTLASWYFFRDIRLDNYWPVPTIRPTFCPSDVYNESKMRMKSIRKRCYVEE
ncbi:hypothetical protein BDV34DRAFT_165978 [Aspergillus parasiticus]|uniref:Transmembrane protein n=3 Tax=Aspergillus subgen. Circumdati TaxID=2720871 RepID=A0A5N6DBP6_ASPPA|nr:hypothetical protein BDV34DRAFT_165978 [Aspergillus parasiticus]KAB8213962.1 hypothetical protein BDV33DRAFT_45092 [Aspergillus novoparasiticus]KAE8307407.1 hypothetical protein BDV41DRAFT_53870 [Aspergillus transmontanensis]